jgi:serine/threonine-protein kinase
MPERVGRYEVLTRLTLGGMAELSLAATQGPGGFRKYVVLKRILPEAADDDAFVKMFLDEARITAAFSHQNICQVFELGQDKASGLYVAMEFIAGQDLNQVVATCARQGAVLPIGFSASVVLECAQALHYAHTFKLPNGVESPVIHRDVAQKNIMVTYEGQVKLLDFGIAKAKGALSRTKAGTVKGTAGYMSPEQVRGEAIDGRSDVFALGVVLWEMVTGRRLFSAETEIEELRMILSTPITPPAEVEPSVPPELSQVVMKALERDLEQRYRSAREFARALSQQCAHLLFDAEERAGFMRERFADRIASTQKLFDLADSRSTDELDAAVEEFRRSSTHEQEAPPEVAQKAKRKAQASHGKIASVSSGKLASVSGAKHKAVSSPRVKPVPATRKLAETVPLSAPLKKEEEYAPTEAMVSATAAPKPGWTTPALVALGVVLLFGAIAWVVIGSETPPPPRVIGEAPPPDVGLPGTDLPDTPGTGKEPAPPVTPKGNDPAPEPKRPPPAVSVKVGDVTLMLPDGATVLRGRQELGRGTIVNFTLPVGTHLLTVRGEDGVRRALSLPVSVGKNRPVKYNLADLPPE